jgi:hypothetical protein
MTRRPLLVLAVLLGLSASGGAQQPPAARPAAPPQSQGRRCEWELTNTPSTRVQLVKDQASGKYNTFVGAGLVGSCRGQNITITADSAELYDTNGLYLLIGRVKYREDRITLDANRATYFLGEEKIIAEENVVARTPDGSQMFGPRAEYYRAVQGIRAASRLDASGRPQFIFIEEDSTGKRLDPVFLIANQVTTLGDSVFHAGGRVEITRTDIKAYGDSAFLDKGSEFARLMRGPVIRATGERPFTLEGRVIDMFSEEQKLQRVLATDSAKAVSEDMTLTSDTIDLRVTDDHLSRAYAWGPRRALVVSPDRIIEADSIDLDMPAQRMRRAYAVGDAYAETATDTTKLASGERDWLRGDTIVARFDTLAPRDTTSRPRIRDLTSTGNASSFYQIPSDRGKAEKPSLNYVRGKAITVSFRENEVQLVRVEEQAAGVFLEPLATDSAGRPRPRPATRAAPPPVRRP